MSDPREPLRALETQQLEIATNATGTTFEHLKFLFDLLHDNVVEFQGMLGEQIKAVPPPATPIPPEERIAAELAQGAIALKRQTINQLVEQLIATLAPMPTLVVPRSIIGTELLEPAPPPP